MPYRYSSSLHGLQYITEDGRHWTERILWIFLCLLGFILTIYFLLPIWRKWEEQVSRQNEKDCTMMLQLLSMQACLERLRDFFFDTFQQFRTTGLPLNLPDLEQRWAFQ